MVVVIPAVTITLPSTILVFLVPLFNNISYTYLPDFKDDVMEDHKDILISPVDLFVKVKVIGVELVDTECFFNDEAPV